MPPFLSTSHCEFYGARCVTTHPFPPNLPVTRELVPSLFEELITQSWFSQSSLIQPYKVLPFTTKLLHGSRFFFLFSFIFITHFFMGLRELA